MKKIEKNYAFLNQSKIDDMRKKRSTRTTFNLSNIAHEGINWLSEYNNITVKEVFDSLCKQEILEKFGSGFKKEIKKRKSDKKNENVKNRRIRKTYVISEKALKTLTNFTTEKNISRDNLLELIIIIHKNIVESINNTTLEFHEKALKLIEPLAGEAEEVNNKLREILDEDDPVLKYMSGIDIRLMSVVNSINEELKNGKLIDKIN